ncbi:HTH domain-containing protein [Candidatus Woesearchaeota archaeon]|nr:HTH domain-containing protein [Candidatus Woesearchaeota archaeon]
MGWLSKKDVDVEKKLGLMNTNLAVSFGNLKRDILAIKEWIDHFKAKEVDNDFRFRRLEETILELKNSVISADKLVGENPVYSEKLDARERSITPIERVQSFNRSDQSFMNVQSLENLPKFGVGQLERLTPAQKNLVALLLHAGGPLGYEEIAKKLGLNLVTVRRHLNDVLRAGVPVMAKMSVNTRRKMFYVSEILKGAILQGRRKAKSEK